MVVGAVDRPGDRFSIVSRFSAAHHTDTGVRLLVREEATGSLDAGQRTCSHRGRQKPQRVSIMPKAPTLRYEVRDFLGTLPQPITMPVTPDLHAAWLAYRAAQGLPPASVAVRSFRQVLNRMEEIGELRVARDEAGIMRSIELTSPPEPRLLERVRALERERAIVHGRFVEASPAAALDLPETRTPALNEYLRRRRAIEEARKLLARSGMDPATVTAELDPLGEEALALKERVLRLELELLDLRGSTSEPLERVAARREPKGVERPTSRVGA